MVCCKYALSTWSLRRSTCLSGLVYTWGSGWREGISCVCGEKVHVNGMHLRTTCATLEHYFPISCTWGFWLIAPVHTHMYSCIGLDWSSCSNHPYYHLFMPHSFSIFSGTLTTVYVTLETLKIVILHRNILQRQSLQIFHPLMSSVWLISYRILSAMDPVCWHTSITFL